MIMPHKLTGSRRVSLGILKVLLVKIEEQLDESCNEAFSLITYCFCNLNYFWKLKKLIFQIKTYFRIRFNCKLEIILFDHTIFTV